MSSFEEPMLLDNNPHDLRLFLEDICCDLCRFEESLRLNVDAEQVRIDREFRLGLDGFADIRVQAGRESAYFVEVKYDYPAETLVDHLVRKYGPARQGSKVVLVLNTATVADWPAVEAELRARLSLPLQIWDERDLIGLVERRFGVRIENVSASNLVELRIEIDRAKGFLAFGGPSQAEYHNDPQRASLLWHYSFWRLRQIRQARDCSPRDILLPGHYSGVVAVIADLCSFSSFVRDTADPAVVIHNLTSFYTKARYQVINRGGMLAQFVGDEVLAFFGLPDRKEGFMDDALETARALLDIGQAISHDWQRNIDRVQGGGGIHVGMAIGDLLVFPQRPFSRTHLAQVGDALNLAARLMSVAGSGEIVMSNRLYRKMSDHPLSLQFTEMEPFEAKNVGRLKAWKHRAYD